MSVSDLSATELVEAAYAEGAAVPASGPSWQDQDSVLRDLWLRNQTSKEIAEALGRSVAAIMTRAARLGLPRRSAPGRKPGRRLMEDDQFQAAKSVARTVPRSGAVATEAAGLAGHSGPQSSLRICLMCLTKFESSGRHNRICANCKSTSEYQSASALPEITFSNP